MMSSPNQALPHLQESLRHCSLDIAIYLATQQDSKGEFQARDFYGKAFAALLWSLHGPQFDSQLQRASQAILKEHSTPLPPHYHFEFNRFALIHLTHQKPDLGTVESLIGP